MTNIVSDWVLNSTHSPYSYYHCSLFSALLFYVACKIFVIASAFVNFPEV